jgi:hypothetical protein
VHGHAGEIVAARLAFAAVQAGPDLDADGAGLVADRPSATDRAGGSIEAGQKPIARRGYPLHGRRASVAPRSSRKRG